MPKWVRTALVVVAAAVVVGALVAGLVWTQGACASRGNEGYKAPRTADGKPDLNGVWQTLNSANYDIEAHPARPAMALIPAPPSTGTPGLVRATPADLPAPAGRALRGGGAGPAGEREGEGGDDR